MTELDRVSSNIQPILCMERKKEKSREVKRFVQGHHAQANVCFLPVSDIPFWVDLG